VLLFFFFSFFIPGGSDEGGREEFDEFLDRRMIFCSSLRTWAAKKSSCSMTASLPES
jgi:hypothetical protein